MSAPPVEVLLAEDNSADAELIMHSLGEDFVERIHHVHDGEEALDFLLCRAGYAQRSFEAPLRLILLDIKLPKVSGLEVLEEIKRDPRTRAIPAVLLTSSRLEEDVIRGYQLEPTVTSRNRFSSSASARSCVSSERTGSR